MEVVKFEESILYCGCELIIILLGFFKYKAVGNSRKFISSDFQELFNSTSLNVGKFGF
jgi:hypothetical protein